MKVYVVGCPQTMNLLGVFTDEAVAVRLATGNGHFVGPLDLDHVYPADCEDWPGIYVPDYDNRVPEEEEFVEIDDKNLFFVIFGE